DALRDRYGVKAIEMEGSGVADAAWTRSIEYFVVRGISDYCDSNKNDDWQNYAAVAAASYTRLLLSTIPSTVPAALRVAVLAVAGMPVLLLIWASLGALASPPPDGALYVHAKTSPTELRIDDSYVATLTESLPFTTIELTPGLHTL